MTQFPDHDARQVAFDRKIDLQDYCRSAVKGESINGVSVRVTRDSSNERDGQYRLQVDIGLIASVFSVIALLMKLGDERKAIASLPWGTIIMICGVGMLISVAIEAGTIDLLGSWIGTNIPPILIPVAFGIAAAFMSLFASTLGVVTPALFPLVPSLATTLSIDPMIIFIAIVVGAQATSISPFSSGGSLLLGSCTEEKTRATLFSQLLLRAAPIGFVAAMLFNLALTFLF